MAKKPVTSSRGAKEIRPPWQVQAEDEFMRMLQEAQKTGTIDLRGLTEGAFKKDKSVLREAVREAYDVYFENLSLQVSSVIIPAKRNSSGLLLRSTSLIWDEIASRLANDWKVAFEIPPEKWEEIVAGAFNRAGYDEVILTPRSGDLGRDVIAVKKGIGCIKVIGSVKAYAPDRRVPHDDVRALLGVLSGERDASKAILTTTADFAPRITSDPFIKPFLPTRLELVNGEQLQEWLSDLLLKSNKGLKTQSGLGRP
jgi:restriction system protein